jgi:hypothetical protein
VARTDFPLSTATPYQVHRRTMHAHGQKIPNRNGEPGRCRYRYRLSRSLACKCKLQLCKWPQFPRLQFHGKDRLAHPHRATHQPIKSKSRARGPEEIIPRLQRKPPSHRRSRERLSSTQPPPSGLSGSLRPHPPRAGPERGWGGA